MICSPLRILKLLLLTARMLFYGTRETFFNKKIDLSRFSLVNCPYERVFKGAVSGAWPDKLSINIGTPRQVLFTTWRDELKSFERALYSFRFQPFFLNWEVKHAHALVPSVGQFPVTQLRLTI